jgi:hypothetical protein
VLVNVQSATVSPAWALAMIASKDTFKKVHELRSTSPIGRMSPTQVGQSKKETFVMVTLKYVRRVDTPYFTRIIVQSPTSSRPEY